MSVELLNIDDIAPPVTRKITIKGNEYPVHEQTVGQMLEGLRMSRASKQNQDDPEYILKTMFAVAQKILPDCPEAHIASLSLTQLNRVIEFANAKQSDLEDQLEGKEEVVVEGKTKT
jgi:hypothetical protein